MKIIKSCISKIKNSIIGRKQESTFLRDLTAHQEVFRCRIDYRGMKIAPTNQS